MYELSILLEHKDYAKAQELLAAKESLMLDKLAVMEYKGTHATPADERDDSGSVCACGRTQVCGC